MWPASIVVGCRVSTVRGDHSNRPAVSPNNLEGTPEQDADPSRTRLLLANRACTTIFQRVFAKGLSTAADRVGEFGSLGIRSEGSLNEAGNCRSRWDAAADFPICFRNLSTSPTAELLSKTASGFVAAGRFSTRDLCHPPKQAMKQGLHRVHSF